MDVEALVRPVVESAGLELWEATFRKEGGRMVLRVVVDREGGVDLEGFGRGRYELEVSSPGLERPLRHPRHFERSVGTKVKVKTVEPIEGAKVYEGALVSADAEAIVVATDGGELRVPYENVASARTVFEWGADRSRR